MGSIHVNRSLDPDRQICRYVSFYELIDLLKFSQIFLARAALPAWARLPAPMDGRHGPAGGDARVPGTGGAGGLPDAPAPAALQLWTATAAWRDTADAAAGVCIVSRVRDLRDSLFPDDATHVAIAPLHRMDGRPAPGDVCVAAYRAYESPREPGADCGLRLRVDVRTLLAGVMVSADAPRRFFELVSAIVQESAWVSVTRAAPAQAGLPRGRAQAMPQDAALQRAGRPGNALAAER